MGLVGSGERTLCLKHRIAGNFKTHQSGRIVSQKVLTEGKKNHNGTHLRERSFSLQHILSLLSLDMKHTGKADSHLFRIYWVFIKKKKKDGWPWQWMAENLWRLDFFSCWKLTLVNFHYFPSWDSQKVWGWGTLVGVLGISLGNAMPLCPWDTFPSASSPGSNQPGRSKYWWR